MILVERPAVVGDEIERTTYHLRKIAPSEMQQFKELVENKAEYIREKAREKDIGDMTFRPECFDTSYAAIVGVFPKPDQPEIPGIFINHIWYSPVYTA